MSADTRDEAVYYTLQYMVWSHSRSRGKQFPAYVTFLLEEFDGKVWNVVREGTYKDAKAEYTGYDGTPTLAEVIRSLPRAKPKTRPKVWIRQAPRRTPKSSRLANLVAKVLNDR